VKRDIDPLLAQTEFDRKLISDRNLTELLSQEHLDALRASKPKDIYRSNLDDVHELAMALKRERDDDRR
jgi:hypothetical protein